jgi:hypothetical protein
MKLGSISIKDILKFFRNKGVVDTSPLIKVELILEVSFETFGQVQYKDENGRPWNKEFNGSKWEQVLFFKELIDVEFSVFINNQFLLNGESLTLIKKIDNEITEQSKYQINNNKLYEGWFKLRG